MYFKCDIDKIKPIQLAQCMAVSTLFESQSLPATVLSLEPVTFEVKSNLPAIMRDRLLKNKVPYVLHGFVGVLGDHKLVIQKEGATKPAKRSRQGSNKSDTDI